jgi:hypothetical protein
MSLAFIVQLVLIGFYLCLTVMFMAKRETWPMSLYYAGCIVKDAGVFILGWWATHVGPR